MATVVFFGLQGQRPKSEIILFGFALLAHKFWLKLIKKWQRYDIKTWTLNATKALVWPFRANAKK